METTITVGATRFRTYNRPVSGGTNSVVTRRERARLIAEARALAPEHADHACREVQYGTRTRVTFDDTRQAAYGL